MTKEEYIRKIWRYYLRLEEEFYSTLNYFEFSKDNFQTYSKEYDKLLLSIGSEVDIVFKNLCMIVNPECHVNKIPEYAEILCNYEGLTDASVEFSYSKEGYTPFAGWSPDNSPQWWRAYNCIKHDRTNSDNEKKGNLENVFLALAGLYVLNRYLCKCICAGKIMQEPNEHSKLFTMIGWDVCTDIGNGFIQVLHASGNVSMMVEN